MIFFNILDSGCSENYINCCNDPGLVGILSIAHKFFQIIQIIAPIILILFLAIRFTQMVLNPEDKKGTKRIFNTIMATLFIYMMPILLTVAMNIMGIATKNSINFTNCWLAADQMNSEMKENNSTYKIIKLSNNNKHKIKMITKHKAKYKGSSGSLPSIASGGMKIPLYYQWQYSHVDYGDGTISSSGCGPTSLAMVVSYKKNKVINPSKYDKMSTSSNK